MQAIQPSHSNFPSLARAIVRENNDPERRGRVRVEYPWLQGDGAAIPSDWARVCGPYASQESGSFFLPEVDDEVLVYFENGNVDFPIVLGCLYSAKNPPPKSERTGDQNENNKNDLKYIRTRSGNLLCFDDSSDKGGMYLKDKNDNQIEINSAENKILISDSKENLVEIQAGEITLKHHQGATIKISGTGISIEGASEIKLGQAAMHALVKGDLFQQLFNAHTHPTPDGPSGPPTVPMTPAMLSQISMTS